MSGWKLLNEGSHKELETPVSGAPQTSLLDQAFYPLTLPLTTGPGSIAVVISIGLSEATIANPGDRLIFVLASLVAIAVDCLGNPALLRLCRSHPQASQPRRHRHRHTAVRLHPFCLGLQILWSGGNELLRSVLSAGPVPPLVVP